MATSLSPLRVPLRSDVHAPHLPPELFGVASFVGYRDALGAFQTLCHQQRCVPLRRPVASQQFGVCHQSLAVFNDYVAAVRQLGFMPAALLR
jgi:hypothetical protein